MLGYIKVDPNTHVIHFVNGHVARAGKGLSFLYFKPTSSIVAVPTSSVDVPFIFNEVTADFQQITLQGQITYRVLDPGKVATNLNFTLNPDGKSYVSEDPQKLGQRVVNLVQVLVRPEVQGLPLKTALMATQPITTAVSAAIQAFEPLHTLGVEILSLVLLSIRPTPEMSRAIEAEAREQLQMQADQAISGRRNDAVDQERRIKENELLTEQTVQRKRQELEKAQMDAAIALEQQRAQFIDARCANSQKEADVQAYALHATLKPLQSLDPKALEVLAASRTDPRVSIAMAMRELAENAGKVGNLNISTELLASLLKDG